jgi:nucleotide-binding universal stress UspA family protein
MDEPGLIDAAGPRATEAAQTSPCVVVGYNGSESSRAAVRWAASSLPADGRLVLVHACRPLHRPTPLGPAMSRLRFGQALFDELTLEGEDEFLALAAHTEVSDEDPVHALLSAVARHGADSIVVGCASHGALQNALGTITSELLAQSTVPVTAVPG